MKRPKERFWGRRKAVLLPLIAALLTAVLLPTLYELAGRPLIRAAYEGRSLPALNRMISDQARRPLEKYLAHGEELVAGAVGVLGRIALLLFLLFLLTLVPLLRSRLLQGLVLMAEAFALVLALSEILLGWLAPVDIFEITYENFQASANPALVLEPRPNAGEFNAEGIRGPLPAAAKPPGSFRILVVGDSLAFGWRVREEETYARRLESLLNRASSPGRFEVINLGVPGYRATQVVERLKEKGLKYGPDLVVYGHWLDDVANSGFAAFFLSPAKIAVGEAVNRALSASPLERGLKKVLLSSQIVRRSLLFAREFWRRGHPDPVRPPVPWGKGSEALPPETGAIWKELCARVRSGEVRDEAGSEPYYADYCHPQDFVLWDRALSDLSGICRERGIPCLLVQTPVLTALRGANYPWAELHRFIAATARLRGIETLDLREEFDKYPLSSLKGADLEHPNARGHEIVAEAIAEWVRENLIGPIGPIGPIRPIGPINK